MIENKLNDEFGDLSEGTEGQVSEDGSVVLATPAALAFVAGAGLVTGAYALGRAHGGEREVQE